VPPLLRRINCNRPQVPLPAVKTIGGDVRVDGQGVLDRLVYIEAEMRQEIDLVEGS